METIGSKRSYALIWCMPNNDDDDDVFMHWPLLCQQLLSELSAENNITFCRTAAKLWCIHFVQFFFLELTVIDCINLLKLVGCL